MWSCALQMKLNADKSYALGEVPLFIRGQQLACKSVIKMLGELFSFDGQKLEMDENRVETCETRLGRIAKLPGSKQDRWKAVATAAIPVLHGAEFSPLAFTDAKKLRRKA